MKFNKNIANKLIGIFILMQPILDLLTSLSLKLFDYDLSAGMIVRFVFLFICMIYLFFYSTSKKRKISLIILTIIGVYIIAYIINNLYLNGTEVLFTEIKYLIKSFYFPVILLSFLNLIDEDWVEFKDNILVKVAFIYAITIFIAQLTGTQFVSYSHDKLGHSGWFYSPNELGAIIAILSPFVFAYAINNRKNIFMYMCLFVFVYSLFIIGTKAPFLGLVISASGFMTIYIIKMFIEKKSYIKIIMLPLFLTAAGAIFILPNTPVGINLNIHLKLLEVENSQQLYQPKNKEKLTNFVFSSRDIYLANTKKIYKEANIKEKIIGLGSSEESTNTAKMIEIDYYDIFYRNGILGFIIYFLPFILIIYEIVKNIFKKFKLAITDIEIMKYVMGLSLAIGIAYFAGHVFVAPAVSIYVIIILSKLYKKSKV